MKFITEFELKEADYIKLSYIINEQKGRHTKELGKEIGDTFGFQNPVNNNNLHHRLEIEAFPMDKWVEFKGKLREYLDSVNNSGFGTMNITMIDKLFRELESFGKPAGDTIINKQTNAHDG